MVTSSNNHNLTTAIHSLDAAVVNLENIIIYQYIKASRARSEVRGLEIRQGHRRFVEIIKTLIFHDLKALVKSTLWINARYENQEYFLHWKSGSFYASIPVLWFFDNKTPICAVIVSYAASFALQPVLKSSSPAERFSQSFRTSSSQNLFSMIASEF